MRDKDNESLGGRLRAARLAAGFSQRRMAEKADICLSFLSRLERGVKSPGLKVARRLAAALGSTIDAVFYGPKR